MKIILFALLLFPGAAFALECPYISVWSSNIEVHHTNNTQTVCSHYVLDANGFPSCDQTVSVPNGEPKYLLRWRKYKWDGNSTWEDFGGGQGYCNAPGCGPDGQDWDWDPETNSVACGETTIPCQCPVVDPLDCTAESQQAINECGTLEQTTWEDPGNTCEYHCSRCDQQHQDLINRCPDGIKNWDNGTCTGRCKDCSDANQECVNACFQHGGVLNQACEYSENTDNGSGIYTGGSLNSACRCIDDNAPTDPSTGQPPPDNPNTPTEGDPSNPDDEAGWHAAVKHDLDAMMGQLDTGNGYLSHLPNIAENLRRQVHNQAIINNSIHGITNAVHQAAEQNAQGLKNVVGAIHGASGRTHTDLRNVQGAVEYGTHTITSKLDEMKTDLEVPAVPEYESGRDPDKDYTEYDDSAGLATDRAGDDVVEATLSPSESPITGQVDVTSANHCISGDLTLRGSSVPVNICFDKPWMVQGYNIMRPILIGIGYLQVALMLNRAIAA